VSCGVIWGKGSSGVQGLRVWGYKPADSVSNEGGNSSVCWEGALRPWIFDARAAEPKRRLDYSLSRRSSSEPFDLLHDTSRELDDYRGVYFAFRGAARQLFTLRQIPLALPIDAQAANLSLCAVSGSESVILGLHDTDYVGDEGFQPSHSTVEIAVPYGAVRFYGSVAPHASTGTPAFVVAAAVVLLDFETAENSQPVHKHPNYEIWFRQVTKESDADFLEQHVRIWVDAVKRLMREKYATLALLAAVAGPDRAVNLGLARRLQSSDTTVARLEATWADLLSDQRALSAASLATYASLPSLSGRRHRRHETPAETQLIVDELVGSGPRHGDDNLLDTEQGRSGLITELYSGHGWFVGWCPTPGELTLGKN
jgi:hypothetical protein